MIKITDKAGCVGCGACVNRCPVHCIAMLEDEEGFLYPEVLAERCINCGLCDKVCPVLNLPEQQPVLAVYGCKNNDDEVRFTSSSGGTFTAIAEDILARGGVAFGAAFDEEWQVHHIAVHNSMELKKLRGSKYVQSSIGGTYSEAEKLLKQGVCVLYSGTPCQIAGLKGFLGREYDNLYTVDVVCHGIPSPLIYRKQLAEVEAATGTSIQEVRFRDKNDGWKGGRLIFQTESGAVNKNMRESPYMKLFLSGLSVRPSCPECHYNNQHSSADLTIADYWGVNKQFPEYDDDKGVTLVMVNNEKGQELFENIKSQINYIVTDFSKGAQYNYAITKRTEVHPRRKEFFADHDKHTLEEWAELLL